MKKSQLIYKKLRYGFATMCMASMAMTASAGHGEAQNVANAPLANITDLYAFRSPDDTNTVTIIANCIPFELPEGGPNYYTFASNVRYEIHIKNKSTTVVDDITYRFTFTTTQEDNNTFLAVRFGKNNFKTTFKLERSLNNSSTYTAIVASGNVPPSNIGARSIESTPMGLNTTYNTLVTNSIATATTGEKVYCGPADDPYFADLTGILDLGNMRPKGNTMNAPKDAMARMNVHSIAIKIPITTLQKTGLAVTAATSILDPDFVIGVWASASMQQVTTLSSTAAPVVSGNWVQVSRVGMPLSSELVIPAYLRNRWNATVPYNNDTIFRKYFCNPEMALYMDSSKYAAVMPGLSPLRVVPQKSLGIYDFRNGHEGLFNLKGTATLSGTALDTPTYSEILLPDSASPRSIDIYSLFLYGMPNMAPYQLATGKNKDPFAAGKPIIGNFLPVAGDMLRLNMAVPVTPRTSTEFSSMGLLKAAELGITNATYNANADLQFIPNMDGFPNGRRLEDDVNTIEIQSFSGMLLAIMGFGYDDYSTTSSTTVATPLFNQVYQFTAGPTENDINFKSAFPYVQNPWRGTDYSMKERF